MIGECDRLRDALALLEEQHTIVWARLKRFRDACGSPSSDELREFAGFAAYLRIHFEAEQEVMQSLAYPGWEEHAAEHRVFEERLAGLAERQRVAKETPPAAVEEWLFAHGRTDDQALVDFLTRKLDQRCTSA